MGVFDLFFLEFLFLASYCLRLPIYPEFSLNFASHLPLFFSCSDAVGGFVTVARDCFAVLFVWPPVSLHSLETTCLVSGACCLLAHFLSVMPPVIIPLF